MSTELAAEAVADYKRKYHIFLDTEVGSCDLVLRSTAQQRAILCRCWWCASDAWAARVGWSLRAAQSDWLLARCGQVSQSAQLKQHGSAGDSGRCRMLTPSI